MILDTPDGGENFIASFGAAARYNLAPVWESKTSLILNLFDRCYESSVLDSNRGIVDCVYENKTNVMFIVNKNNPDLKEQLFSNWPKDWLQVTKRYLRLITRYNTTYVVTATPYQFIVPE